MTGEQTGRPGLRARVGSLVTVPLLIALLAVDLVLAAVSVGHLLQADGSAPLLTDPWLLETDGGWAERFGYVQQAALALLLVVLALVSRRWLWVAWAAVFAAALADDSLRLHENKGAWLAEQLEEKLFFPDGFAGLRANDLGEILVWGLLAVVPLAAVVLLHWRSNRPTRRASTGLAVLVGAYVFCGVVLDQVHVLALETPFGDAVGTLEDGGELVVLSVTVAYVATLLAATLRRRRPGSRDESPVPAPAAPATVA